MDKNSNFYRAVEEAIIKSNADKMRKLENSSHNFSNQYNYKISEIKKSIDEKNHSEVAGLRKIKMSFRYVSVIVAVLILAGAVAVTANEAVRQWIYKIFTGNSSSTESVIEETYPTSVYSDPPHTDITAATSEAATVTTVVSTSVLVSSTTDFPITSVSYIITRAFSETDISYPVIHHNINVNQRPSMQLPSRPTSIITTVPNQDNKPVATTVTKLIDSSAGIITNPSVTEPPVITSNTDIFITQIVTELTTISTETTIAAIVTFETTPEISEEITDIPTEETDIILTDSTYTTTIKTTLHN